MLREQSFLPSLKFDRNRYPLSDLRLFKIRLRNKLLQKQKGNRKRIKRDTSASKRYLVF